MDYLRPDSLDQALAAVAGGARVLAGGTDLYPGAGARLNGTVVDTGALPGWTGITTGAQGLRIGAGTTWTALADAVLPPACHALQQAARQVGGRQVQNVATLAGNLCNASPAADGVPPLLVLEAEVEVVSNAGTRRLPLAQFLQGPRRVALRPGELVAAVHLPQAGLAGVSDFAKLGVRAHLVISIASVAVRLQVQGAQIMQAAVAVGACAPMPVRLPAVEAALCGPLKGAGDRVDPTQVAAGLAPIDDIRAPAGYRLRAAAELVRRLVERLA